MAANYCSEENLAAVNGVRTSVFGLSLLACLVVLVAWIYFACHDPNKAKWTDPSLFYTAVRLPFYVLVLATIHSVVSIFQLATLDHHNNHSTMDFCIVVAFFSTLSDTSIFLISIIVPVHLMLIGCKKTSDWLQDKKKRRPVILEVGYIVTVTVGSLIAASVPLLCLPFGVSCYGYDPEGQWCWITDIDENCTEIRAGWDMQIMLYYVPTFVAVFLALVLLVHICIVRYKKKCPPFILRYLPDQQDQGFTSPVIALTIYLFLFSVFNIITFAIRIVPARITGDSIVISIFHSFWGFIPSVIVGILVCLEWKGRRKEDYEAFESPPED